MLLIQGNPIFKDDNISYRAVIQRELEYGMMYASLSTGFRSGGFSIRATSQGELRPYQSEEVESMELGIRLQPTDNSQINITYFDTDYTDMQVNGVVGGADPTCGKGTNEGGITCTFFRNAGEVSFDGWEFEGLLMPTESLTIRAMFGILDGGFEKYDFDGVDIADRARVLYAPEHSGSISFELNTEIGGGTLITTAGMSFKGQIDGTHLIINTILTDLERRMLQAKEAISVDDGLYGAVATYLTIINLRNGDIQSSQVSQDNNSVNQLTEGLGNMTMTVNPMNTINTTVQAVNRSTNLSKKDTINEGK